METKMRHIWKVWVAAKIKAGLQFLLLSKTHYLQEPTREKKNKKQNKRKKIKTKTKKSQPNKKIPKTQSLPKYTKKRRKKA